MPGGITFGAAKTELATVVANGQRFDDARVMPRTNEATKALLDEIIPVNGMLTGDIVSTTESGRQVLLLPKEFENAIEVEVLNSAPVFANTDVLQGWNLVTNFTYVDPAGAHDNPLVDLGLVPDPGDPTILRRKYHYPGLAVGATVRVTGAKRYVPITADGDYLIVQNVRALKLAILSIERDENSALGEGDGYLKKAVELLQKEVRKHQLDPSNSLKRKANYQQDLTTYAEGSLGRTRAKLALELPGFLQRGKSEITYLINRAVQMLVDNRNQLQISGRIGVHESVTPTAYQPASAPSTELAWTDYNHIRLMVQSFITESGEPQALAVAEEYQKQAYKLQEAELLLSSDLLRHTTYTTALSTHPAGTYGNFVARLVLELEGGLRLTTTEIERLADRAEMRLMERGLWRGTLEEFKADIVAGEVLFPVRVLGVLAADVCGMPVDVRSIFFDYVKNGPGKMCTCEAKFTDLGEVYFADTGNTRRRYRYDGSTTATEVHFVCKLRWIKKVNADRMTLQNFEAIKLMAQSLLLERAEKWGDAQGVQQLAVAELDKDLNDYLGGIQHTMNVDASGMGMGGLGGVL